MPTPKTDRQAKPELLSPAGSRRSLEAAIEAGTDAVYLGAGEFNARMRAENFQGEELCDSLRLCRAYSVKSYITLNTRVTDNELSAALALALRLYEYGADALIVADHGLARAIHEMLPDFELHASTQLSGHTVSDAAALGALGFSRMVCPREFSMEQLTALCQSSPLEIEMFIHGAYCVSFSGQCLMSACLGGRSGNRGECAQPCRQPYKTPRDKSGKNYPISLRDMSLCSHITDIIASGAASLKIEGRQKPPEYVYGVTKIYRQLLDESRNATPDEVAALRAIFSRDGFTDGYFKGLATDMRGVRTYDDFLTMDKTPFEGLKRKVPLSITLHAVSGERASLCAESPTKSVTVYSDGILLPGDVRPITPEGAEKNAGRLGGTPYVLESFTPDFDDAAPITLSALNALRRSAVEKLTVTEREITQTVSYIPDKAAGAGCVKPVFDAEFLSEEQITPLALEFFDEIYLPYGAAGADNEKYGVSLPPYLPDSPESSAIWDSLSGRRVLVHHTGQLYEAVRRGLCAVCSLRFNTFNSESAGVLCGMGAGAITLSPELTGGAMREVSCGDAKKRITAYGRLPLMTTVRCAISDGGRSCPHGKCGFSHVEKGKCSACRTTFTDRRGTSFPVFALPDCTNIIYNSCPIYCADKPETLRKTGAAVYSFLFTNETAHEVDRIITAYKNKTPPAENEKIRRL